MDKMATCVLSRMLYKIQKFSEADESKGSNIGTEHGWSCIMGSIGPQSTISEHTLHTSHETLLNVENCHINFYQRMTAEFVNLKGVKQYVDCIVYN